MSEKVFEDSADVDGGAGRPDVSAAPVAGPGYFAPTWDECVCDARATLAEARAARVTLATAESCTGGLVSGALTAVPGSSDVVLGGVVSYANEVKEGLLGVGRDILDRPGVGAVSEPCARLMAEGARRATGADVAVSVTGIAGPGGAVPGKPVGTVWFGLSTPAGTRAEVRRFPGDRSEVRLATVRHALYLLREGAVEAGCAR